MDIDFDQIRELLAVVCATDISEITIESGEEKITVRKSVPSNNKPAGLTSFEVPVSSPAQMAAPVPALQPVPAMAAPSHNASLPAAIAEPPQPEVELVPITSPMVGTFYRASTPSAPPFVDIGDRIKIGQTVCIIEAMKLMNDLPTEVAGRIVKVCAENGSTVEYGQPLFMVDPA